MAFANKALEFDDACLNARLCKALALWDINRLLDADVELEKCGKAAPDDIEVSRLLKVCFCFRICVVSRFTRVLFRSYGQNQWSVFRMMFW